MYLKFITKDKDNLDRLNYLIESRNLSKSDLYLIVTTVNINNFEEYEKGD